MYKFKINNNEYIEVNVRDDVFKPTGTSNELIKAVSENITTQGSILDLGCGTGLVGIALHKLGKVDDVLYGSDISENAVQLFEENAKKYNVSVIAKSGNSFNPWKGKKFDYIVDDVSGISDMVAPLSPWFNNVSCCAGVDGADLIIDIINESPKYLKPKGKFFFPVLSFSNIPKIINQAKEVFFEVERISHKEWIFPDELTDHIDTLKKLKESGNIDFSEKFGLYIWYTDIYMAHLPRS
jgi:release factor glutamine methyltransferase